ncbi:MAG: GNAT family N-acetyltransferase [Bacteroidia bacterium]|nr:GNAT family N-acetyltransferase [Bacteroidia bacterium]
MYTSRKIDDNSYPDIQQLLKESFGINRSVDAIKEKYATEGFGLKNIGIIAKNGTSAPAAYYGVFPMTLQYAGKDYMIAQSGDTMTAPNHRKKGLFTRLAKETYELCKQSGIQMVFGFPNENSYPGFERKLDWVFTGRMQKFTIKTNAIPLCQLAQRFGFLKSIYTWYFSKIIRPYRINHKFENLEGFQSATARGQIKKDENFFDYKLNRENTAFIQYNGFKMLIKARTHLIIGDVAHFEKSKTKFFLAAVRKLAKIVGSKKVLFTVSKNHWLFDYLNDVLEFEESLPIGFYIIDPGLDPKEIQFTHADYDTF